MNDSKKRYQILELCMCALIAVSIIFFIIFLCAAGTGTTWLKILSAIICILICCCALAYLYLSKELFRPRSLWMGLAAAAIVLCILFSLILNFPSPNPLNLIA